jgi:hypothetical protein
MALECDCATVVDWQTGISMLRLGSVLLASAMLAGCANEPQPPPPAQLVWLRVDGQRGAGNLALTKKFETDRRACLGATPQANAPVQPVEPAATACMANKGYIQVPQEQAEAKSRALAAAYARRQTPPR